MADPQGSLASETFGGAGVSYGNYGSRRAARTTIAYSALATTTTNDLGQSRTERKNADGKVVLVTDANGATLAHRHDAFGNLVTTRDALGNETTATFDVRGRRTALVERNAGEWRYDYNALGELVWQQSANQRAQSQQTTMEYDLLGRLTRRVTPDFTSQFFYDRYADNSACNAGTGQLCETSTTLGMSRRIAYDNIGRPTQTRLSQAAPNVGPSFGSALTYDTTTGRVSRQRYPSGVEVGYEYTTRGYLASLSLRTAVTVNPLPSTPGGTPGAGRTINAGELLWQAEVVNAWGRTERERTHNGVFERTSYQAPTGRTLGINVGTTAPDNLLSHTYAWDSLNRLTNRAERSTGVNAGDYSEAFVYDGLNRLTQYTVTPTTTPSAARTVVLQYNALGQLLYSKRSTDRALEHRTVS